jgi:gliding motility-associated-like protein
MGVINNNTSNPSASFNWNTSSTPTGIYTFYVTVKNNHCPISNTQTIAYTINVTPIPTISATVLWPTGCVGQAYMQYNLAYGFLPRQLTIYNAANDPILSYTDTSGTIRDSLPVGSYTAVASSNPLCSVSIPITISDSGSLPLAPMAFSYCLGDPEQEIYVATYGDSARIYWYDSINNALPGPPTPNTGIVDSNIYYLTEIYKVCTASHVMVTAVVHALPTPEIINTPPTICIGDTIYLAATGGVKYNWSPAGEILTDKDGKLYTRVLEPKTLTVDVTDQYGCMDSASVTYTDIQQCCTFAYPNAFTPNGDGRNDGFRVITYGNMLAYKLTIFNRWGQVVYDSNDPREYWDGTRSGAICDMGTYYYYFRGTCLTGHVEEYKGDVTLIR